MKHKIAVIALDGIGNEVMPEGLRVLDAAMKKLASTWNSPPSSGPTATTT